MQWYHKSVLQFFIAFFYVLFSSFHFLSFYFFYIFLLRFFSLSFFLRVWTAFFHRLLILQVVCSFFVSLSVYITNTHSISSLCRTFFFRPCFVFALIWQKLYVCVCRKASNRNHGHTCNIQNIHTLMQRRRWRRRAKWGAKKTKQINNKQASQQVNQTKQNKCQNNRLLIEWYLNARATNLPVIFYLTFTRCSCIYAWDSLSLSLSLTQKMAWMRVANMHTPSSSLPPPPSSCVLCLRAKVPRGFVWQI